jgi:hypothetical protein
MMCEQLRESIMPAIATRILSVRQGDQDTRVSIRIFAPEASKQNWSCRYEIAWPDGTRKMAAGGVDSVQALRLALQMIGAEIYTSEYHKSGNLIWHETGRGYGFPVASNLRDLLQGDDAKFY